MTSYDAFLDRRARFVDGNGFDVAPPSFLFDFQSQLVRWALKRGRAAIFADCGLGKTPMQLTWADAVVRHTNRPVLVVAPLSASAQTLEEAQKFGIDAERSRDGSRSGQTRVVITNYERLHLFDHGEYAGMVCDESSILKNFDGVTKAAVTEFMRRMTFRLLCTATAAPNDYIELGTSSEALGELGFMDMISRFFTNDESSLSPMSSNTKWRLKGHAQVPFWRWMCSWARAVRRPSDLGCADGRFVLPPLEVRVTTLASERPFTGKLFVTPAATLQEQREERRATIRSRCEHVAAVASHNDPFVAWAHLNDEADLLECLIPGAVQVSGSDADEAKEEKFHAFTSGQVRALVTKPKIGAFGLNWQHCAHMSFFPSHSYEQYYQAVRRCWRFGQARPVVVDVVTTEGESDVMQNLQRKADAADRMFKVMVDEMAHASGVADRRALSPFEAPLWLGQAVAQ
jgi:hypothetical protein